MRTALITFALSLFRRLPVPLRRLVVRIITPSYVVGAVVVIRNDADEILLLRERHHEGWGLPGGLLSRRELPATAAIRELREEVGLVVDATVLGSPTVAVDPDARRVDVIFLTQVQQGQRAVAHPPEVIEVGWFAEDALPELFEPSLAVLETVGVSGGYAVR